MSPPTSDGPDWVRETLAVARDEVRRFVATTLGFMLRPARFSADWLAGETRALNPLGYLATALAISSAVDVLFPGERSDGIWVTLALATLPYVYYVMLGVLCHPVLRLVGSQRPLRASVAVALFAGGGPGLIAALGVDAAWALRHALYGPFNAPLMVGVPLAPAILLGLISFGPFLYFLVALARGLGGLHGLGRGRAALALLVALVVSGLLLGVLHARVPFSVGIPHFAVSFVGKRHYPVPDLWW